MKLPKAEYHGDYTKPFHKHLWLGIIFYILINSLLLIFIKRMLKENISSVEVAFAGLDPFCNQDGSCDFKKHSLRLVQFMSRLISIFIITVYNAIFISYLFINAPHIPFKSLEEFSRNGQYQLILFERSLAAYYFEVIFYNIQLTFFNWISNKIFLHFQNSNNEIIKHIYNNLTIIYNNTEMLGYDAYEKIFDRVCHEKLALTLITYQIDAIEIKCEFMEIENPITYFFSAIQMGENSPFTKVFNYK